MYNRYIPQSDGSYRRDAVWQTPAQEPAASSAHARPVSRPPNPEPVSAFLRQLLPSGFDTGDLIIVLLLLLMAGDNPENRSNALLTLALYFVL